MKKTYDFTHGKRGAVVQTPGKERITIRLDKEVLDWFRQKSDAEGRGGYQTLINEVLRAYAEQSQPIEDIVRHVIREELQSYGANKDKRDSEMD